MHLLQCPSSSPSLFLCCSKVQPNRGLCLLANSLAPSTTSSYVKQQWLRSSRWVSRKPPVSNSSAAKAASVEESTSVVSAQTAESDVLKALSQIIDPDFGTDIVSFRLKLTTPACPIKDMFEQQANEVVANLHWVKNVKATMSAQPAKPVFTGELPPGLQMISNIIAVSSCKGGVGKSTVAVNLAYTLARMGARVGSLMPMCPMVSGVINQLLTTTEWGELDYLVIDMPPGTGDIQLTLCQVVPLTAAVIVTTPQKLAFIDVVKGVRMFSKLKSHLLTIHCSCTRVPCVAAVENMCHFDADGKRYYPLDRGSGSQVVQQFGIPHLFNLPIRPTVYPLTTSGDSGMPEVVADPLGEVAKTFQDLGVLSTAVTHDKVIKAIKAKVPDSDEECFLHPTTVRRNNRSAQSVDEWTGEQKLQYSNVLEDIEPEEIQPMGNYAVSIVWPDGFNQLQMMERLVSVLARPLHVHSTTVDQSFGIKNLTSTIIFSTIVININFSVRLPMAFEYVEKFFINF
ncbi:hypothetical protein ACJRO7_016343 [Eucalyptus globulus]|uniref:Gamma-butyrobetaine hydroxylase-like N-terminal domain-containing protein n=1 Tax=Eucalyptus globulus TaxID=34317 RepID=A0ABD3L6Q5_EUCGL